MKVNYYTWLIAITGLSAAGTYLAAVFFLKSDLPPYTYAGLVYLALVMALMHYMVHGRKADAKVVVRRMMAATMLRMLLAVTYLLITLANYRPVNLYFVGAYCAYFLLFLLFEISQIRYNLRPDFNQGQNKQNA